ncbi:MAG: hypothetical protein ACJ79A_05305 [Gemmatimonadaceae bacterium]
MTRLTITAAGVALLAALAGACTGDVPTAAVPSDPALAKGGPSAAAYTVLDVGALLPGSSSQANGVNDAGDVVGYYYDGSAYRAFALVAGASVTLGSGPGLAWGMSNGSPAFVAGSAGGFPVRWSLADPSQTTSLTLTAGETSGSADAVNDAGDAVGVVGANAAMWLADGTRIPIATPAPWVRGEGRGIDNDGLAIFQFSASSSEYAQNRAYVRLASGALVELPPVGSDVTSYANDISEVVAGTVYVAGSTLSSTQVSRSVRWTVNASTGAIIVTDVLATTGAHGLAVSDAGGIAGFIENTRSLRFEAYLWRGTDVLKLAPPKGSGNGQVWTMSRSGRYLAGKASTGAVRWTIAVP